jgi:ketosteroid isomerase-like protein
MRKELPLEFRISRQTVESLRNLCDAQDVPGASNLLKEDLVIFVKENVDRKALEDFLRAQEDIYFVENMAKAIKWASNKRIVELDPESDHTIVNAVFTMRRSDGYEVFNIRFVNQTTEDVDTVCECVDFREKGYFCPHQMSVLVRCLSEGMFDLDQWTGPMTPEVEDLILANVFRKKRKAR